MSGGSGITHVTLWDTDMTYVKDSPGGIDSSDEDTSNPHPDGGNRNTLL